MSYKRKTRDVFVVECNYGYGHGWEHECTEETRAEARQRLREYRANSRYPARLRKVRERVTP